MSLPPIIKTIRNRDQSPTTNWNLKQTRVVMSLPHIIETNKSSDGSPTYHWNKSKQWCLSHLSLKQTRGVMTLQSTIDQTLTLMALPPHWIKLGYIFYILTTSDWKDLSYIICCHNPVSICLLFSDKVSCILII